MLQNNYDNSQALSGSNDLQKLLFHSQEYLRAAAPSGPLSYYFGMATSGEPSTWLPLGKLEGQEPLPLPFLRKSEIFKKISSFFKKKPGWIEFWNCKVIFIFQYHFYKLQYVLQNNYGFSHGTFIMKHPSGTTLPWSNLLWCAGPFSLA